jgi:hypothetical protein
MRHFVGGDIEMTGALRHETCSQMSAPHAREAAYTENSTALRPEGSAKKASLISSTQD